MHEKLDATLCPNCNNEERWELHKCKEWFTLFFLPVLPYKTEFSERCPICSYGYLLSEQEYASAMGGAVRLS